MSAYVISFILINIMLLRFIKRLIKLLFLIISFFVRYYIDRLLVYYSLCAEFLAYLTIFKVNSESLINRLCSHGS